VRGDTPTKAANCRALMFIGAAGPKVNADARDSTSTANPHQISIRLGPRLFFRLFINKILFLTHAYPGGPACHRK
jgi:hypothetical protein